MYCNSASNNECGNVQKQWYPYARQLEYTFPTSSVLMTTSGKMWRELSWEEKEPYYKEQRRLQSQHIKQHPGYKYQPKRRPKNSLQSLGTLPVPLKFLRVADGDGTVTRKDGPPCKRRPNSNSAARAIGATPETLNRSTTFFSIATMSHRLHHSSPPACHRRCPCRQREVWAAPHRLPWR